MQYDVDLGDLAPFSYKTKRRIWQTLMYFGGSIGLTASLAMALRNFPLASANPWLMTLAPALFFGGIMMTDYET